MQFIVPTPAGFRVHACRSIHLQQAMHHAQETSYEEAVEKYMQDNEDRIGYWVTGEL